MKKEINMNEYKMDFIAKTFLYWEEALRLFGKDRTQFDNNMMTHLLNGEPIILNNYNIIKDFIFIKENGINKYFETKELKNSPNFIEYRFKVKEFLNSEWYHNLKNIEIKKLEDNINELKDKVESLK